jgi:hypothetical protein
VSKPAKEESDGAPPARAAGLMGVGMLQAALMARRETATASAGVLGPTRVHVRRSSR